MSRAMRVLVVAAALSWIPTAAHAETWVAPFVGGMFGTSGGDPNSRTVFGADVGGLGGGVFGAQVDFGYHPHVFGDSDVLGSNYLLNFNGDLLIATPTTVVGRAGIRPFLAIGAGLIRTHIQNANYSKNDAAFDVGGGVLGYFSKHAGLRGDIKYYRVVNHGTDPVEVSLGDFHYWRATVGLVLR